jgi:hypothetical protein
MDGASPHVRWPIEQFRHAQQIGPEHDVVNGKAAVLHELVRSPVPRCPQVQLVKYVRRRMRSPGKGFVITDNGRFMTRLADVRVGFPPCECRHPAGRAA